MYVNQPKDTLESLMASWLSLSFSDIISKIQQVMSSWICQPENENEPSSEHNQNVILKRFAEVVTDAPINAETMIFPT